MIKNWDEIKERFDEIKDHKPRASKKLNELGDILSSAYRINKQEADNMWQYIVELNIPDDVSYSKFYIAQVFNKLIERMSPEEATDLVSMNPERVRLMIIHGYDGGTLWKCLDCLIKGYMINNQIDYAVTCIGFFYEKFGGENSEDKNIIEVLRNVGKTCGELIDKNECVDEVEELLNRLGDSSNCNVRSYVEIIKAICGKDVSCDYDLLFNDAIENKYPVEFFELLFATKDNYSQDDLIGFWIDYINNCEDNDVRPWNYIHEYNTEYEGSKLQFYVDLEKNTDELLDYYFNRPNIYDVEKGIIWQWIEEGEWDRFSKYIAMVISNTKGGTFNYSSIKITLDEYVRVCSYSSGMDMTDNYGRSYKTLMNTRKKDFADVLSRVSAMTVGCEVHEEYHEFVKDFVQKISGNLDSLNNFGFNENVESRSAEQRLKDYIHDFFENGEDIHEGWNTKYSKIMDALNDELYDSDDDDDDNHTIEIKIDVSKFIAKSLGIDMDEDGIDDIEESDDEEDRELEQKYRLASDDEIVDFYFQHAPREYNMRTSLISACIKKNDIERAIELVDLMAETESRAGYDDLNGWGRQNMLTMLYIIQEYDYDKKDDWQSEDITDDMREIAKQLVYRMMSHLPDHSQKELKKELYKIDPQNDDKDDYITKLLEDATAYSTIPRPRGKGGAQNINAMSHEFIECFERLSKMGRMDVVAELMSKFSKVSGKLKPIDFDRWMIFMTHGLKAGDTAKVFNYNREIFEIWLESNNVRQSDIISVASSFGDGCTREEFNEFRNLVITHHGNIDGLDSCFTADSDNTETQLMLEGETVEINLDYIEIFGSMPINNIELHLLSRSKSDLLDSVRVSMLKINGITADDYGFYHTFDSEPQVGYYVFDDDEVSDDELTVYSGFFDDNEIDELSELILRIVTMDDEDNIIEEFSDIVIKKDNSTGEFKVHNIGRPKGSV